MSFKGQTATHNKALGESITSKSTTSKFSREKIEKQLINWGQQCPISGKTFLYCHQVSSCFPMLKKKTLEYWRMQSRESGDQVGPKFYDTKIAEKSLEDNTKKVIKKKKRRGVVFYYFDDLYQYLLSCQCTLN